jgi:hypothetical protein
MWPQIAEISIQLPNPQTLLKYALFAGSLLALASFAAIPAVKTTLGYLQALKTQARALKTQNPKPHETQLPTNPENPANPIGNAGNPQAAAYALMIVQNCTTAPAEIQISYILKGLGELEVLHAEVDRLNEALSRNKIATSRTMFDKQTSDDNKEPK